MLNEIKQMKCLERNWYLKGFPGRASGKESGLPMQET